MSKKKDEIVEEVARSGDRPELVEAAVEAEVKPWTETLWGTRARWACVLCPFDTLDGEAVMAEHYLAEHAPPAPAPVERVQVYDRWGNAV